jgi:hypothetical protein
MQREITALRLPGEEASPQQLYTGKTKNQVNY